GCASVDACRLYLDRRAAGGADSFLHLLGHLAVVPVARRDLDPAVRHADQGLLEIVVGEADRLEVGAGGRAVGAVHESPALVSRVESHAGTSLRLATRKVNLPCCTTSPCWSMRAPSSTTKPPSRMGRFERIRERPCTVSPTRTSLTICQSSPTNARTARGGSLTLQPSPIDMQRTRAAGTAAGAAAGSRVRPR